MTGHATPRAGPRPATPSSPPEATTLFLVGQALACLTVVVGPFDVWHFDRRLLDEHRERIRTLEERIAVPGEDDDVSVRENQLL